ncbi:MAG: sulfotransferase [Ardenticatenales bacterium]|nr:sulfotransferase [Ardenticatenales bacterium]
MSANQPILVTGAHRSGSTWTGKMLALAPRVAYIHEPFNMDYAHPGKCTAHFPYRFTYITTENEAAYRQPLRRTIGLHYNVWPEVRQRGQLWPPLRDTLGFGAMRLRRYRALVKDPMAVFSAAWLAQRFDMAVVVVIRHPAAFAGSIKRFGWHSPFHDLLAQPLLLRDWLHPFAAEMQAAAAWDIVDQAALMWQLVYTVVRGCQERYPHWIFVRHETLSRRPEAEFAALYARLGLPFSPAIAAQIRAHTSPQNPASAPAGESAPGLKLDSRANIWNWRQRLTAAEIARVRARTETLAGHFYDAADWDV